MLALLRFTNRIHYLHSTSCNGDSQARILIIDPKQFRNHLPMECLRCCCPLTWFQVRNRETLINPGADSQVNMLRDWIKRNQCLFCLLPKQHPRVSGVQSGEYTWVRGVQLGTHIYYVLLSLEQIHLCCFPEHCSLWKGVGRASAMVAWSPVQLRVQGCLLCTAFQQI